MSSPLTTNRNNYHDNIKDSTIFTPKWLSHFIYDIYVQSTTFAHTSLPLSILDPAVGSGNLLKPFEVMGDQVKTIGYDIEDYDSGVDLFRHQSFLSGAKPEDKSDLVILNPPFNTDSRNKDWLKSKKMGRALLPEVFLDTIFTTYGATQPIILIAPMGLRLNQRVEKSHRYKKFCDMQTKGGWEITSIASLPLDIFPNVEFHVEVTFWNIHGLKPHYWFDYDYVKKYAECYKFFKSQGYY